MNSRKNEREDILCKLTTGKELSAPMIKQQQQINKKQQHHLPSVVGQVEESCLPHSWPFNTEGLFFTMLQRFHCDLKVSARGCPCFKSQAHAPV